MFYTIRKICLFLNQSILVRLQYINLKIISLERFKMFVNTICVYKFITEAIRVGFKRFWLEFGISRFGSSVVKFSGSYRIVGKILSEKPFRKLAVEIYDVGVKF